MNFEIVNTFGDLITTFELESNPFKVDEIVHIDIHNNDPEFWDKKELRKSFKIIKIEHSNRQFYNPNNYSIIFTVSLIVKENN